MIVDLLATDNMVSYNVKIANVMGLHTAIYLTELINISLKAERKKKLVSDKYFLIDRKYITQRTTLSVEEQITIEQKLAKIEVIQKPAGGIDTVYINVDKLAQIISSDDDNYLNKVSKNTVVKTVTGPGMKQTLKQRTAIEMKGYITTTHKELKDALEGWVDGVLANPNGFLSKRAVGVFEKTVDEFANGDLDVALKIIEIATVGGYRDATWAINSFNKDHAMTFRRRAVDTGTNRVVPLSGDEVF